MTPIPLCVDPSGTPCPTDAEKLHLLRVARDALVACLEPGDSARSREGHLRTLPLFVTLWTGGHVLRGCVGHVFPICATLEEEVAQCARSAALSDTRFEPLTRVDGLTLDVTLLGPLQPVEDHATLDPQQYGVLVEGSRGRRGVLLPNVEGVDTVAAQLGVARRKAGIQPGEDARVSRFCVCKFGEEPAP